MWGMAFARSLDWSIPVNFFSILGFWVHLIVFGEQKTNEMMIFVAKNSGGGWGDKEANDNLKRVFFSF